MVFCQNVGEILSKRRDWKFHQCVCMCVIVPTVSPFCELTFDSFLGTYKYTIHGWYGINRNLCKKFLSGSHINKNNYSQLIASDPKWPFDMPDESHSSPHNLLGNPFGPLQFRYAVIWYHMIYNKSQMFSQVPFQVYQGHSLNIWNRKTIIFMTRKTCFFLGNKKLCCSWNLVCFCLINEPRLRILSLTARLDRIGLGKLWIMIDYFASRIYIRFTVPVRKDTRVDEAFLAGIRWFPNFLTLSMRTTKWSPRRSSHPGLPPLGTIGQVNLTWLAGLTSAATVGIIGGALCL